MNWYTLSGLSGSLLRGLADASLSAVVLAALAAILVIFLRRNPLAHHALWTAVMIGMLALPAVRPLIPAAYLHLPQPIHVNTVTVEPESSAFVETATQASATSRTRSLSRGWKPGWSEYIALVYLAGVGLLGVRILLGLYLSRRLLRSSRSIASELWQHFDQVAAGGGEVQLEESHRVRVPLTIGLQRMRVIFPAEWRAWPPEKLEAVLAHELAHARRRDPLISVIAAVNKCVFWFHPLAWWLERRLASLAEHAADDSALASSQDAQSYARTLLEIASSLQQNRRLIWRSLGANEAAMSGPLITQRIRRILDQKSRNYSQRLGKLARLILLTGAAFLIWVSTTVDFQSVARAQEKQNEFAGGGTMLILTGPGKRSSQDQPRGDRAASDANLVAYWSEGEEADAKPIADEQATEMERQLAVDPENEEVRANLLRYYWHNRQEDKRTSLVFWLIDHHPESSLHGQQTAAIFLRGPHGNAVVYSDAKSRWLAQVNQHPDNANILGNAARVVIGSSVTEGMALMKRAQMLDPAHRTGPLAWFYSLLLMQGVSRQGSDNMEIQLQILSDLRASNDILLVGAVARSVAVTSAPTPEKKAKLMPLATELLKHAEALEPQNHEWPALLARLEGAPDSSEQQPVLIETTPQLMRISKAMAADNLVESEPVVYPPLAQTAHIHGTVILQVRIGKDGHVNQVKAISGHPILIKSSIEAVKNYVYKPFLLDGSAVDVETVVEVPF
ncbi:MAG TPA: M56 family metallopeptidase [Candidatus Angelobacter sp.]|jgi:beta-lactamase regulating signal transducer with metallopeptidase domain|nr:M56 family metallopeptidase [Candidatus Angelobacter sp.]